MSAYFFHTTDGSSVEIDRRGQELSNRRAARGAAAVHACEIMARRGPSLDWSAWAVHIYDALGEEIAVLPFAEADAPTLVRSPVTPRDLATRRIGRERTTAKRALTMARRSGRP